SPPLSQTTTIGRPESAASDCTSWTRWPAPGAPPPPPPAKPSGPKSTSSLPVRTPTPRAPHCPPYTVTPRSPPLATATAQPASVIDHKDRYPGTLPSTAISGRRRTMPLADPTAPCCDDRLRPGGRRWVSTHGARTPTRSPRQRSCPWPVVWERGRVCPVN